MAFRFWRPSILVALALCAGPVAAALGEEEQSETDLDSTDSPVSWWDIGALVRAAMSFAGNEFYVSPTGSDSSPGSIDAPWETLAFAFTQVAAGDTLWVRGGTWTTAITTETMAIQGGSSWATMLLVAEYPGDTVIVQPASGTRVLYLADSDASYIEFRDIDFDGVNVTSDVVKLTGGEGAHGASHHIRIRGGSVKNAGDGVGGDDLEQGILVTDGANFNEFIGIEVANNGEVANRDQGIYISTDDNLVEDCDIHDNAANGVQVANVDPASDPHRNIVRNNEIYNNGTAGATGEGVTVCGEDNLIELNNIHGNQADGVLTYDVAGECLSINSIIRFNWIHANGGSAIFDDPTATDTVSTPNVLAAP